LKRFPLAGAAAGRQLTVERCDIFPLHRGGDSRAAFAWVTAMADDASSTPREVYFEITLIGAHAKVAAIDGASGVEVMVLGPAHAAETALKRLAAAKLRVRLARLASGPA
jgi:hypothetical protein